MWKIVANRSGWGATPAIHVIGIVCVLLLSACSSGREDARVSLAPPPPAFALSDSIADRAPATMTLKTTTAAILAENQVLALSSDPPVPAGCRLKDRFDRSALWSMASSDGRKKLALASEGSVLSLKGAMLRYTYKLQPGKSAKSKEHCLYPSQVQGLLPSTYRELVKRKSDTVWTRLKGLKADVVD